MKKNLPSQFNKTEQISTVYTLINTMQSKIFNHKKIIKTLDTKNILNNMSNLLCNCITSPFTDPNHGHPNHCPKQQIKETVMQSSQLQGTSLH